jgi:hypothetical protein
MIIENETPARSGGISEAEATNEISIRQYDDRSQEDIERELC